MAKLQFNCRLEESVIEWIDEEAARQTDALGRKFSQADVVTMLVGSASMMATKPRKVSKREAEIEKRKSSDVLAQVVGRDDIDYSDTESLPMIHVAHLDAVGRSTPKASVETWRANRKPLMKPKDRK